jgi:hypothetical protein
MDQIKVDPFTNVVNSGKATTQFIPDRPLSLDALILQLGGTSLDIDTEIARVTVKVGGKELFRLSGAKLDDLNNRAGIATEAAHLLIPFSDFSARTQRGQHLGAFDMTVYRSPLTIEVDLVGADAPTLEARALVSPPKAAMGLGYTAGEVQTHRALIETVIQPAAAVVRKAFGISLGSEAGALIRTLNFFHAEILSLNIKRNGLDIYEDVAVALNNYIEEDIFARSTVAGLITWDPTVDGNQSNARTTVNADGRPANYQVMLTTDDADTITVLADVYTKLPLL